MKFDKTGGKPAKYCVRLYSFNVNDTIYFNSLREAKAEFDKLTAQKHERGTVVSIYDMKTDTRKAFLKK